jgi:antitoxin CptB
VSIDRRRERLRFRSWHRGTREIDLLLGSFADARIASFSDAELDMFEAILSLNDPDLYNWITGAEPIPAEDDSPVLRLLCTHQFVGA